MRKPAAFKSTTVCCDRLKTLTEHKPVKTASAPKLIIAARQLLNRKGRRAPAHSPCQTVANYSTSQSRLCSAPAQEFSARLLAQTADVRGFVRHMHREVPVHRSGRQHHDAFDHPAQIDAARRCVWRRAPPFRLAHFRDRPLQFPANPPILLQLLFEAEARAFGDAAVMYLAPPPRILQRRNRPVFAAVPPIPESPRPRIVRNKPDEPAYP